MSWGQPSGARRIPGQQPLPRHPDPQGRAHLPAGAGRADARPRRQDLGAAGRRHAAGHRREARPGLSRADPHHGQHQLEQPGALRPVREHAAAAGDPVARRGRRRRQQGAEAVAHARWLRPPRRAAGRRADPAGRRRPRPSSPSPPRRPASMATRTPRSPSISAAMSASPSRWCCPSGVATDRLSEGGETDLSRWFLLAARCCCWPTSSSRCGCAACCRAPCASAAPRRPSLLLAAAVSRPGRRRAPTRAAAAPAAAPGRAPTGSRERPARRRSARSRR